jgi:hypothetical protein
MDFQITKNRNVLLLFLLLGGIIFVVFRVLDFDGLYGQDAYAYKEHAWHIKSYLLGGSRPPKFFWPVNYPFLAAIVDFIVNDFTITLQVISILSWSFIGYFSYRMLRQQYPNSLALNSLLYVVVFISFAPYLVRFAGCSMSDELTTLFVLLCFKFSLNTQKKNTLLWAVTFGLLAVFTRYGAMVLVAIPITYSFYHQMKKQPFHFYISLAVVSFIIVLPYFYFNGVELYSTLQRSVTSDWSMISWFQSSFESPEGTLNYDLPNIIYAFYNFFHPLFLFIGLPLIIYAIYHKINLNTVILVSVVLYSFFIAGIHFQNKRFLVLCIPLVSIILYPSYNEFMKKWKNKYMKHLFWAGFLTANLVFSAYTTNVILSISKSEKDILNQLSEIQKQEVYTFEIDIPMKGRNIPNQYHNLWEEEEIFPKPGSIIIINSEKWKTQWSNHHVMKHCRTIESSDSYKLIEELSGNWKIYKKL